MPPVVPNKHVTVFRFVGDGMAVDLPQEPGIYLWFISDIGYFKVGSVHILKDRESHKAWLRLKRPSIFIYKNRAGDELTMYHEARDSEPPMDADHKPFVDGYVRFEMKTINDRMAEWDDWAPKFGAMKNMPRATEVAEEK